MSTVSAFSKEGGGGGSGTGGRPRGEEGEFSPRSITGVVPEGSSSKQKEGSRARRAAVALVLRVKEDLYPFSGDDHASSLQVHQREQLRSLDKAAYEVLFIKRAVRPNTYNRWSGHVAFPGGHVENGETLLDAAKREAAEEVGLDLNSQDFDLIGVLPSQDVFRTDLVVCPFVFLQVSRRSPPQHLNPLEVAESAWVALDSLSWAPVVRIPFPAHTFSFLEMIPESLLSLVGLETVYCRGLRIVEKEEGRYAHDFVLWGMTLAISADLVDVFGGTSSGERIDSPNLSADSAVANTLLQVASSTDAWLPSSRTVSLTLVCTLAALFVSRL